MTVCEKKTNSITRTYVIYANKLDFSSSVYYVLCVPSVRNKGENGLVDCSVTRVLGDGSARKRGELATERRSG